MLLGLPNLFRKPPPQDMPIAVQLVTIAPETRATQPNPFRPRPEAKPEPPLAEPAPIPGTEAGTAGAEPGAAPAAAAAPAPPPPAAEARSETGARRLRRRRRNPSRNRRRRSAAAAEAGRSARAARPAAGSGAQAQAETRAAGRCSTPRAEAKPEARPKPEPKPEAKKADPAAFSKLLQDLETPEKHEKKDRPDAFDSLLKNLTKQQTARTEEPTPAPRRVASLSPPSSQPKAPLGTELTASEIDVVRQQLSPLLEHPGRRARRQGSRRHDPRHDRPGRKGAAGDDRRSGPGSATRFSAPRRKARAAPFSIRYVRRCVCRRKNTKSWKTFEIELSPKDIL